MSMPFFSWVGGGGDELSGVCDHRLRLGFFFLSLLLYLRLRILVCYRELKARIHRALPFGSLHYLRAGCTLLCSTAPSQRLDDSGGPSRGGNMMRMMYSYFTYFQATL